ncbi:MAG: glucosamine-6-phosphate deaminase [Proteobacteria bacterium]|nr:glucosamine-6-phosphate deaminase [Pseudomonadota bacterium]
MRLLVSKHSVGKWAAYYIYKKIIEFKPTIAKPFILGLPTGTTPIEMYQELIKLYQDNKLSFKHVISFNMDEYVGLPKEHPQSYHHYMHNNFFDHIDINHNNIYILDGNASNLELECKKFEENILQSGGLDLIVGGVGEDGHIAFNEPGSSLTSLTRVKRLNYNTILANSRFFNNNISQTPSLALTMGIKTILDAKDIVILAKGVKKASAVANAIEGAVSGMYPITALQMHNKVVIVCDEFATYNLKVRTVRYFEDIKDEYSLIGDNIDSFSCGLETSKWLI